MTYSISPSRLSIIRDCPRCFWLHYNGVQRPRGIFPSLPSGMDGILKEHFDKHRVEGTLPPELSSLEGYRLFSDAELLSKWQNWRKGLRFEDSDGNVLCGALDYVLEKDSKLVVLDFKTRGYPLKDDSLVYYQDQMNIYTYLLQKEGYVTEDCAYLLVFHPTGVADSGDVSFHADLVRVPVVVGDAEELFVRALRLLEGSIPPSSSGCEYCAYSSSRKEEAL